jgi:hypothetical protein
MIGLSRVDRRHCAMTTVQIRHCLRDLHVVATTPHITEEQITELLKKKLIQRNEATGGIRITQLGVHAKTGEI